MLSLGGNATEVTGLSVRKMPVHSPLAVNHTRTVQSVLPLAMSSPLPDVETEFTSDSCPLSVDASVQSDASQRLTRVSHEPLTRLRPSRAKAREVTSPL